MKTTHKLSDIKPVGNFESVLKNFADWISDIETKGTKGKEGTNAANFIKTFVGELDVIAALENFQEPYKGWNKEEQKICLLYAHLLVIRANNLAQESFGMKMEPSHTQLMEYINGKPEMKKVFGKLVITPN